MDQPKQFARIKQLSIAALVQINQQNEDQHGEAYRVPDVPAWGWSKPEEIAESMGLPPMGLRPWDFAGLGAMACFWMNMDKILERFG